eukprot:scaffold49268_cov19-Tisochrysis_lutea.AAC.1
MAFRQGVLDLAWYMCTGIGSMAFLSGLAYVGVPGEADQACTQERVNDPFGKRARSSKALEKKVWFDLHVRVRATVNTSLYATWRQQTPQSGMGFYANMMLSK